jgi:putative membrane protein
MLAPLLLVSAAPVTLALRALRHRRARVLARLLRSRPVTVVTHPAVAALPDVGGLWLLYRTDLYALAAAQPPLLALVHLHMLLAGYLFAFSLVGPGPAPHRPGLAVRAGVLVLAVAAHDVLATLLYAAPPPGVAPMPEAGMLMHYGALPVHVALFVLLGREWAAGQERARRRELRGRARNEELRAP